MNLDKQFAQRVEVCYPDEIHSDDVLVILVPYLRGTGKFLRDEEKIPIMYRLLKGSSIRFAKNQVVMLTPIWLWNSYLKIIAESSVNNLILNG